MLISTSLRRAVGLAAVSAAALAASGLTAGATDLAPEDERLVVIGDSVLPLDTAAPVAVIDLAGVEHAEELAAHLGDEAIAIDAAALLPVVPDEDTEQGAPVEEPAARINELVATVRGAEALVVVTRRHEVVEATVCRAAASEWLVALGVPTVLVADAEPDADAGEPTNPVLDDDPVGATASPTEEPGEDGDDGGADVVLILAATVDHAAVADMLTGAVRATGAAPELRDQRGKDDPEKPPGAPGDAECPELPVLDEEPEPQPSPTNDPTDPTNPAPSASPDPDPAPEPSPSEPAPSPAPTEPAPTETVPAPSPGPSEPPSDTEVPDAPAPQPRDRDERTPWRLPEAKRDRTTALSLSVDTSGVDLSHVNVTEDRIVLSGELTGIAVLDRRHGAAHGWTLSARASDLAGPATIAATQLGWTPRVSDERAQAGPAVVGTLSGGPGLEAPTVFGSAPHGTAGKPVGLDAAVVLETTRDVPAGAYAGTLTLTLFPSE